MMLRIRRAGVAVALTLLMATALAGAAWASNVIRCADSTDGNSICEGTEKTDVIYGTNKYNLVLAYRGVDTVYGRGGNDNLNGGFGPDTVHGGPGDDQIGNGDSEYWYGRDENHGGQGNDQILGQLSSEKHFGGRGNDEIYDARVPYAAGQAKNPDVFRCGPGRDYVYYNKGIDKVANDCEILIVVR